MLVRKERDLAKGERANCMGVQDITYPVAVSDDDNGGQVIFAGDTGALALPAGTTAQRPIDPLDGSIRYNETTQAFEGFKNGAWGTIGGASLALEINTAGVGAPKVLSSADNGKIFINKGITEKNYYTLPTPGASDLFDFKFANYDADGMRIVLPAGVSVIAPGLTTAPAGYLDTTTIGASLWLVSLDTTTYALSLIHI